MHLFRRRQPCYGGIVIRPAYQLPAFAAMEWKHDGSPRQHPAADAHGDHHSADARHRRQFLRMNQRLGQVLAAQAAGFTLPDL